MSNMNKELRKLKSVRSEIDAVIAGIERRERSKDDKHETTTICPIWEGYGRKVGEIITRQDANGRLSEEVISW